MRNYYLRRLIPHSAFRILHYFIDVREVPALLVIIQAIAHDELVGDVHGLVIDGIVVLERLGFEEQRGDPNVGGIETMQLLDGIFHGVSRIDDIFHDDHVAAFKRMVETDELAYHVGRLGTSVGGQLHKRDLAGDGEAFEKLGGEHKSAIKDQQKQRIFAHHVLIELIRNRLDGVFNLLLWDVKGEILV